MHATDHLQGHIQLSGPKTSPSSGGSPPALVTPQDNHWLLMSHLDKKIYIITETVITMSKLGTL